MGLSDFRSVFLHYCLKQISENNYVALTPTYKPVGFKTIENNNYTDFPILVKIEGLTPDIISRIYFEGNQNSEVIYLYDDNCLHGASQKNMETI